MRMLAVVLLMGLLAGCTPSAPDEAKGVESLFSDDDVAASRASCLRDKGWDVELNDGVISVELPEAQRDRYLADSDECLRAAGVDPDAGLTDEQYRITFDWYSEIAECLDENGWSTPEKPSFEVFRSTYDTTPWIPWQDVPDLDRQKASSACPVMNVPTG